MVASGVITDMTNIRTAKTQPRRSTYMCAHATS